MSVITTTYTQDKKLSANFMLSEFLCKDGTKKVLYSTDLVSMLQKIIDDSGVITIGKIVSGYRTPDYSVKVGGTKADAHTKGMAVDIQFKDASKKVIPVKYIACLAQDMGFGGIGVMNNSIHLDVRHLGGYSNKKWWGDETKNYSLSANGTNFYKYYGLTQDAVYKYLQVGKYKPQPATTTTQTQNTAKTEPVKQEPVVVKEEPKVEKPIIQEVIDIKQEPEADTSAFTEVVLEPVGVIDEPVEQPVDIVEHKEGARPVVEEANAELSHEAQPSGILATLKKLFKLILDWINS